MGEDLVKTGKRKLHYPKKGDFYLNQIFQLNMEGGFTS